ncbi:MAG: SusC/RagA family TonB-linked outer membrane protein [Cyclobacteriaceae bacterium]
MKLNLLDKLIMLSKLSLYGLVIQCFMLSSIWAEDISAQKIQRVGDVEVELGFSRAKLQKVFRTLEQRTDFHFSYSKEDIDPNLNITFEKGQTHAVRDVLMEVSKKSGLRFRQVNRNIIVQKGDKVGTNESVVEVFIKDIGIEGKITDENGDGLPGASVVVKGTTQGTTSDIQGNYKLNVPEGATITISFVGYSTQELVVGNQSVIDVQMQLDAEQLEEVVVVGYGTQKKSDLTGSVTLVSTERLDAKPNTNFTQALQGALPGVNITTNSSGAEQGDVSILIRGRNSINASNSPLIIFDGVPYSGNISDINTADIASITVLKDASSTAIYGSRGANGVILIETKKGKGKKPTISYNGYYGITKLANIPEVYDGQGFAGFKETREPGELTQSEVDKLIAGEYTDWLDLSTQNGTKQEHSVAVSGSTERAKYYVSIGYLDAEGVSINDKFQRAAIRLNLTYNITDNLTFGTSTQLTRIDRSGLDPDFGGEAAGAFFMNPLASAFDQDGKLTIFPWPEDEFFENPLAPTLATNDNLNNKIFTSNYLEYSFPFVKGLSYRINTGVEYDARNEGTYWGRNTARGFNSGGDAEVRNRTEENYLMENILNYNAVIGKHSLAFTGLYSAQKNRVNQNEFEGSGFPSDLLTYRQMNLALGITPRQSFVQETIVSQMGRLNYGYDDRFLLTFTIRRDGFSGFGDNNKYGTFPSVALGWNISEEDFFPKGFINRTKLRISYGENGNQAVGAYDNLARLNDRSYVNGNQTAPGFVPDQLANNELSWETTSTFNMGLDFGFVDDRFQLSLDLYQANTSDLLLDRLIPSVHGITEVTQNIGETKNSGIELTARGHILNLGGFKWQASGNLSYNKNEIVSLFGKNQDDVGNRLFIGQPIRVNYGFVFDGIWQEGDDIANSAQPGAVPGDVRVKDLDNPLDENNLPVLGISSEYDRAIQGQRDPKLIWGLENTFQYKNFSLYVFAHAVNGITRRSTIRDENVFGGVRRNWYVLDYWTPDNPIGSFNRNNIDANIHNVGWYNSANFIRIKDITLSYNFDNALFGKTGLNNARIYFTARNLFTITNWEGLDPELSAQSAVPLQKEFIFGLNFSL